LVTEGLLNAKEYEQKLGCGDGIFAIPTFELSKESIRDDIGGEIRETVALGLVTT